jgi:hypothetical protein
MKILCHASGWCIDSKKYFEKFEKEKAQSAKKESLILQAYRYDGSSFDDDNYKYLKDLFNVLKVYNYKMFQFLYENSFYLDKETKNSEQEKLSQKEYNLRNDLAFARTSGLRSDSAQSAGAVLARSTNVVSAQSAESDQQLQRIKPRKYNVPLYFNFESKIIFTNNKYNYFMEGYDYSTDDNENRKKFLNTFINNFKNLISENNVPSKKSPIITINGYSIKLYYKKQCHTLSKYLSIWNDISKIMADYDLGVIQMHLIESSPQNEKDYNMKKMPFITFTIETLFVPTTKIFCNK